MLVIDMKLRTSPRLAVAPARGFTMFELMVVVMVMAIITALAAPSFRSFIASQRIKSASFNLTSALLLARNEALKRNGNVQVVRTGTSWNNGWQIKLVSSDAVLGSQNALDNSLSFTGAPDSIVFDASGRVSSPTAAVRIQLASSAGTTDAVRCVALTLSGHARSSVGACS
jgi:type IV fimbrial biogenesis protein FimT